MSAEPTPGFFSGIHVCIVPKASQDITRKIAEDSLIFMKYTELCSACHSIISCVHMYIQYNYMLLWSAQWMFLLIAFLREIQILSRFRAGTPKPAVLFTLYPKPGTHFILSEDLTIQLRLDTAPHDFCMANS